MKLRKKRAQWLGNRSGMPIGESERIEITKKGGIRSIVAEGVLHILLYGTEEMIFSIVGGRLEIRGRELSCTSYASGAVCITGEILSLSFCNGGAA
ncbi:MAG: YabP/YqfC family sporulation protein [Clostridia bacterium]|nr:YabP/YqfC family sporulation protein [Clostridia bacterium]